MIYVLKNHVLWFVCPKYTHQKINLNIAYISLSEALKRSCNIFSWLSLK